MPTLYPKAEWMPGPMSKTNQGACTAEGVVLHSMVGGFDSAMARMFGTGEKNKASWHFSIRKDGRVYQHYDIFTSTWHAGGDWNLKLVGIEHEGGPLNNVSEPLTEAQVRSSIDLVNWIAQMPEAWPLRRQGPGKTLYEHNEVFPTQCPSGRIPWNRYLNQEQESVVQQPVKVTHPPHEDWRDTHVGEARIILERAMVEARKQFGGYAYWPVFEGEIQRAHRTVYGDGNLYR